MSFHYVADGPVDEAPYADPRVRRAIARLIDRGYVADPGGNWSPHQIHQGAWAAFRSRVADLGFTEPTTGILLAIVVTISVDDVLGTVRDLNREIDL